MNAETPIPLLVFDASSLTTIMFPKIYNSKCKRHEPNVVFVRPSHSGLFDGGTDHVFV